MALTQVERNRRYRARKRGKPVILAPRETNAAIVTALMKRDGISRTTAYRRLKLETPRKVQD